MIRWVWLIPTLAIGAAIGLILMGCLVSGKIADLENALWISQTACNNPWPWPPWELSESKEAI